MMKNKLLYNEYNKLIDKLLFGVALTDKQMTFAAEEIVAFICKNNLTYLFDDIIIKTFYDGCVQYIEKKTRTQLETKDGYVLNHKDMVLLGIRILYNKKIALR